MLETWTIAQSRTLYVRFRDVCHALPGHLAFTSLESSTQGPVPNALERKVEVIV